MNNNLLPKRQKFKLPFNPDLANFYLADATKRELFIDAEKQQLIDTMINICPGSFAEIRDNEINRLSKYYDSATDLFGIDFRAVARTRIQTTVTIMLSSAFFMQSIFEDELALKSEKGANFFESRINTHGLQFNATSITTIEGFPMGFSVLKRTSSDKYGEFGIDLPAISLPRQVLSELLFWHKQSFPELPFEENPLLSLAIDIFTIRIHDWFHAAVIYDSQSMTKIFQKWSENSFFVEHLFKEPNMINYEFISDKVHHLVWLDMIRKQPEAKVQLLDKADRLLLQIQNFENWMKKDNKGDEKIQTNIANFLGFVGLRGLFHAIPFNSKDLLKLRKKHPRIEHVISLLPPKIVNYLTGIYSEEFGTAIPFRKGSNKRLSLNQILTEYTDGLYEEARIYRHKEIIRSLWQLGVNNELLTDMQKLPEPIKIQLDKMALSEFSPVLFNQLNKALKEIGHNFGVETENYLASRTEVTVDTGFYLMIDAEEIASPNPTEWSTVTHQKFALITQIPYEYPQEVELKVERTQNLLATESGAIAFAQPGDLVLINIQDKSFALNLIGHGKTDEGFDFESFWNQVMVNFNKGNASIRDMYPYSMDAAINIYNLKVDKDLKGRDIITTDYYAATPNSRFAVKVDGPISMNAADSKQRRRILKGALVENHIKNSGKIDIFPVEATAFEAFYTGAKRNELPNFKLKEETNTKQGLQNKSNINDAIIIYLEALENINNLKIFGNRGKPNKTLFRDLTL